MFGLLLTCGLFFLTLAIPFPFSFVRPLLAAPSLPKVWVGEDMEPDQGGVSLHSVLFHMDAGAQNGSFSFLLKGRKTGLTYAFQTETNDPKSVNGTIWKIKEDTYDLLELISVDSRGRKYSWKGPYKQGLLVKAKYLSVFGAWYMLYGKAGGELRLLIKPQNNNTPKQKLKNAFAGVIDGLTGRHLETYQGKVEVENGFRAVIRSQRQIQMVYRLDLFKDNRYGREVAAILSANDAELRSCYTDLLEAESVNQGALAYTLVYSGEAQSIKALKLKATNFKNTRFLECMNLKLLGLTFPVKKSMIGELSFQFQATE